MTMQPNQIYEVYVSHLLVPAMGKVNYVYLSKNLGIESNSYCLIKSRVFKCSAQEEQPKDLIRLNNAQREYLQVNKNDLLQVLVYKNFFVPPISLFRLNIEIMEHGKHNIDKNNLCNDFKKCYIGFPFNKNQIFYFVTADKTFRITVVELLTPKDTEYGEVTVETNISFKTNTENIFLTGMDDENALIRTDFSFEDLGIGGLKNEFSVMFRRAFVQRVFNPETIKKLGIPHVKGILLYGPPGTGKTLIARQIGSLLNARPPKIVNGPEILNKYVGQSEENIRNLFSDAEEEYKKMKEKSLLHIIIFDELDAIFKTRGSSSASSGIGDQIVNQLLSKMDGVEALDNILIIGMTNRPDLIDKALLRPGRFEIHIEISLPGEEGRLEIFNIHTKTMKTNNFLEDGINFNELARLTRNYTGAEICAVVKSAASYALERQVTNKKDEKEKLVGEGNVSITMNDFLKALEEVRPNYGTHEEDFRQFLKSHYDLPFFLEPMNEALQYIKKLRNTTAYSTSSYLFYGKPGTGKTSVAVKTAFTCNVPFIKMISPKHLVGMSDFEKVNYIKEQFEEAYKSEESIVILDEIESLIDYVSIGPRFSNTVLQAIKIFIKSERKYKLFVMGTTSEPEIIKECGIMDCFTNFSEIRYLDRTDFNVLCTLNKDFRMIKLELPISVKNLLFHVENQVGPT